ncbi:MAG: DUF6155 family protein [Bacteroidales bacterium]|nr:DUF6155 family protein [Bacteroidales bacterium]
MSKTVLRKELRQMSREQLEQIIIDAYDARREIKEYFEFFLNPDVEKLLEKHLTIVTKELSRVKWGRSRARVSNIKKAVKDFMGFAPGPEAGLDMMMQTLIRVAKVERFVTYTATQERYAASLIKDIVSFGDTHQMADVVMARIGELLQNEQIRPAFRRFLADNIES